MIRYAAHRIYLQPEDRILVRHMVELDADGCVMTIAPFSMEVHHTIWIDGLILLSPLPPLVPQCGESFADYTVRLAEHTVHSQASVRTKKMRAYRTVGFDIPAMCFRRSGALIPLL